MIKGLIRGFLKSLDRIRAWSEEEPRKEDQKEGIKGDPTKPSMRSVVSLWDFIKVQSDTQADHLLKVVGFEEWVEMSEIRRRIKEVIQVEYQNERSLYPYIKTLVDVGFFETISVGGKRKWRKKDLLVEVEKVSDKLSEIAAKIEAPKLVLEVSEKREKEKRNN